MARQPGIYPRNNLNAIPISIKPLIAQKVSTIYAEWGGA
jgi:hypothetical protein